MKMRKKLLNKYEKDLYGKKYLNSNEGTRVIDIEIMDIIKKKFEETIENTKYFERLV